MDKKLTSDAEKAGEVFGEILAYITIIFLSPTIIWLILSHLVGIQIAWVQVFGIYLIYKYLVKS